MWKTQRYINKLQHSHPLANKVVLFNLKGKKLQPYSTIGRSHARRGISQVIPGNGGRFRNLDSSCSVAHTRPSLGPQATHAQLYGEDPKRSQRRAKPGIENMQVELVLVLFCFNNLPGQSAPIQNKTHFLGFLCLTCEKWVNGKFQERFLKSYKHALGKPTPYRTIADDFFPVRVRKSPREAKGEIRELRNKG